MTRIAKLTALALLTVALGACGAPGAATDQDADQLAAELARGGGKADDPRLLEAALGGSYSFELSRKSPGAETTARHARVLRFTVEAGETVGAVLRRVDGGDLDGYLALFADGQRVLTSRWSQGLVPMARERDAALVFTAPRELELLLFVADAELAVDAAVRVDLVRLEEQTTLDLSKTNPAIRAFADELRQRQAQLAPHFASGALFEGEDGLLEADPSKVESLKERAGLSGLRRAVNDLRLRLYAEHVAANVTDDDPDAPLDSADIASVGRLCGQLWSALR